MTNCVKTQNESRSELKLLAGLIIDVMIDTGHILAEMFPITDGVFISFHLLAGLSTDGIH